MPRRLKLRGPLEKSIQDWILVSLGIEKRRWQVSKKTGDGKWVRTGLYVSRDGKAYWWRANSGRRVYEYTTKAGEAGRGLFKAAPKGTADILGVCCGVAVALEVKRDEDEQQTPEQREWQAMHEAAGGVYVVVRSPSEAKAVERMIRERMAA